jgi:PAS domain S-box-containing protein
MIIYSGIDIQAKEFKSLKDHFTLQEVSAAAEAIPLLKNAEVYLLGPEIVNPSKEVQKIYAADKHLAIVVLALPSQVKQIKQTFQFSPFIGKNTIVVSLNPEINLASVCESASIRTRQKRNFSQINLRQERFAAPKEKVKLAQMGTFLEYAPVGAIIINDTNRIVNFNRQAKNLFPNLEFLDVELSSLFLTTEAEVITNFIHDGHEPHICKEIQFQQRILELTSTDVYNEDGIRNHLLLFNDVTNQRLEVQRIQSILEALPQMAWTTDTQGAVSYFTQAWYFYTGQAKDEALGSGWISVIFSEDRDRLIGQWNNAVKTGSPFQQAARYKNNKGEHRWHLARASAIRDKTGHVNMWVGTCTDIHDQILLTEELERKVKERTLSLEISNSELEQFAHISSHDLQEPLRKIRTFAELLKDKVYPDLDETSQRYLDKINATAERMSASLKALLNYTMLRREEKFEPVNLNEVLSQVLVDLELMISQKNANIKIGTLPAINASSIQMQQLFYNLLNNALKFSKNDIPPEIEISSRQIMEEELIRYLQLQHFEDYYEIIIKDNGIGFEQKHADRIFTIFQRLHPKTSYEGTGIGLSLVKKVVNNHGGEVHVYSQPNEGTSFYIILPGNFLSAVSFSNE